MRRVEVRKHYANGYGPLADIDLLHQVIETDDCADRRVQTVRVIEDNAQCPRHVAGESSTVWATVDAAPNCGKGVVNDVALLLPSLIAVNLTDS